MSFAKIWTRKTIHFYGLEKLNYICACTVNPYESCEVKKALDIRCNTSGSREFSVLFLCFEEFKEETCRFLLNCPNCCNN